MVNVKYFIKGFFCIKSANSPAIALFASFIAIGALFKSIGLNIQESIFSTFLTPPEVIYQLIISIFIIIMYELTIICVIFKNELIALNSATS